MGILIIIIIITIYIHRYSPDGPLDPKPPTKPPDDDAIEPKPPTKPPDDAVNLSPRHRRSPDDAVEPRPPSKNHPLMMPLSPSRRPSPLIPDPWWSLCVQATDEATCWCGWFQFDACYYCWPQASSRRPSLPMAPACQVVSQCWGHRRLPGK